MMNGKKNFPKMIFVSSDKKEQKGLSLENIGIITKRALIIVKPVNYHCLNLQPNMTVAVGGLAFFNL